ncbi:MAG: glycosyltransferase family 25 protein [Nitrososphaerales archaeon]
MFGADKIYLINLAHRNDRLRMAKRQFEKAGIEGYTVFPAIDAKRMRIRGVDETNQGLIGCFLSHFFILHEAIINKYKRIVIFEDDIIFEENFEEKLMQAMKEVPEIWQMIYLGYYERYGHSKIAISKNVSIPKNTWGTHAYMLQGSGIKMMYDNLQEIKSHIDVQIDTDIVPKIYTYCITPALCRQSGIKSDIK